MTDSQLVEELTQQVLKKLDTQQLWQWAVSCQTVCVETDAEQLRFILECGAERVGISAKNAHEGNDLRRFIDHTLLRPDASQAEVTRMCEEGRKFGFASVCINPTWVTLAARALKGSETAVCTVVGFPLGAALPDVKAYEARRAICDGATEIDMVINVGALKSGKKGAVATDIEAVVEACHSQGAICKVIIETALLTEEEKVVACSLAKAAGADFVKTSTGFGPAGATAQDVRLMRQVVGPEMGIKAAGGIKDSAQTREMIAAGATRIGASAGVKIVQGNGIGTKGGDY